ncbi:BglG family transcription antiterminator [Mesobacillus maritimus]|uniref:BglG family transcription antiterminator n=1 Tax=Mesobacillus maritimus TaxID=1643336 RepID=UPI00203FC955|nr:BglG family transcription antiterminator [Mesobacillus maritimus]MCM3670916.1 BglG family transcription antiterminator [Mesobacillus maritimus]
MNHRQRELLRLLLLREEGALQINDLAAELSCAEKTVRNDLDRLEEFLEEYPGTWLVRKPGIGISIEIDEHDRSEILRMLLSSEPKTVEERLFEMAFQLLTRKKGITLQYWADRYYVPKATIKKDLETITEWLERFGLELVSKQRVGHTVQGEELKKRNALAHLSELVPTDKNVVLDLFFSYEIATVRTALKNMQQQFLIGFTDEAVESLLVHALVMIKRTRQKAPVFVTENEIETTENRTEYSYASWFFSQLEEAFQLKFPKGERVYFTWHLISGKRLEEGTQLDLQQNQETTDIVQALVGKMSKLTLYPFYDDSILMNGLAVHMHSVINRIRFGFPITNPLLSDIKRMYPYMFSMVMLSLEDIHPKVNMEIPEDEAAYIVLHFQASIERLEGKREVEKKKALIVCHMGIGMSHLLEAKIEQQYQEIEVVACIGKAELSDFLNETKVDFIISTLPLEKVKAETIVVSPLFSQEDKKRLSQFVKNLQANKRDFQQGERSFSPFLKDGLVFFNVDYSHRYEVVEMLSMALYEKGYVQQEFIYSSVNRERKSATAIGGGIAIPHGDPSLIQRPIVAVAILKEPLEWGNEMVSLVFMLALSKENQKDLRDIIGKLASLSEMPAVVHELTETKEYQQFKQVLEKSV